MSDENDDGHAMTDEKTGVEILDDGAVRKDGRLLTEQEEAELRPLGDALERDMPGSIAASVIHSPLIESILALPAGTDEKRDARLRAVAKQLQEKETEDENK